MKISILGDSISTFEGYNPEGYEVYYNSLFQSQTKVDDVSKTWWAQVIDYMGGSLCVNGSYSGSRVSGVSFPSATSAERISALRNKDKEPDIILVYIGMNDFGYCVPLYPYTYEESTDVTKFFLTAYLHMLKMLKEAYPNATIICATLMKPRMKEYDKADFSVNGKYVSLDKYNEIIKSASIINGCVVVDLAKLGVRYQTLDGAHPDIIGHKELAQAWISCLKYRKRGKKLDNNRKRYKYCNSPYSHKNV